MKISYNWLKWYVPEIPEPKKPASPKEASQGGLEDIFTYHLSEVESVETLSGGDTVFDINILPNRAHDLLSHLGIARELSGQLGIAFNDPTPKYKIPESQPTNLSVSIDTPLCRRYAARIIRGVKIGPSPEWVVQHLASIGQRSINNIVDATNIVMFDCGQPTHAFDLKKLSSEKISIRQGQTGETMTTLDGKAIELKDSDMVIADEKTVLALAGVKGGTAAEVDDHTMDIVLEVANFDPISVRKTARKNGILTDSAKRFENDLSPTLVDWGMRELSALILEMCPGATFEEVVDVYPKPAEEKKISFSLERVSKLLGSPVSDSDAEKILKQYGYVYEKNGETYVLTVPPLRLDLVGVQDIAEEFGRVIGYDAVTPKLPEIDFTPRKNETYERVEAARAKLITLGYSEVMTYSFTKKGKIEVARGAKGKEFLRTQLSDGLKDAYERNRLNAPLLGDDETKIFEIGSVYPEKDTEVVHVAYADKKGVVESTLEEFSRDLNGDAPLVASRAGTNLFTMWSLYPFIARDVAVWVSEGTDASGIADVLKQNAGEFLTREPQLFDTFTKDGKTSMAFRLVFQSPEKTLTDEEIGSVMNKITASLKERGWEVR